MNSIEAIIKDNEKYGLETAICCKNKSEAKEFLVTMHKLGYMWITKESLLQKDNFESYENDTAYIPSLFCKVISFTDIKKIREEDGMKVVSYADLSSGREMER